MLPGELLEGTTILEVTQNTTQPVGLPAESSIVGHQIIPTPGLKPRLPGIQGRLEVVAQPEVLVRLEAAVLPEVLVPLEVLRVEEDLQVGLLREVEETKVEKSENR